MNNPRPIFGIYARPFHAARWVVVAHSVFPSVVIIFISWVCVSLAQLEQVSWFESSNTSWHQKHSVIFWATFHLKLISRLWRNWLDQ
jgi:hypothetical protein